LANGAEILQVRGIVLEPTRGAAEMSEKHGGGDAGEYCSQRFSLPLLLKCIAQSSETERKSV
jgi:hypothetical protein